MRLWITRLELADFRNYRSFSIEPDRGLTILVGPNAIGKTNIIEAIELVTEADSFRKPIWSDLVRDGAARAEVALYAESEDGRRPQQVSLVVEGNRRAYKVNGAARRAVADVAGTVPAVVFTPDDLRIVKGAAEKRRAALDSLGGQISKAYGAVRAEYERIVRQRNALLRGGDARPHELAPWTERLVSVGAHLAAHRVRLFARLAPYACGVYGALSGGEELHMGYVSSWGERAEELAAGGEPADADAGGRAHIEAAMALALRNREAEERARRTTLVGPHRDDIRFEAGAREARAFASQGQQRTIALSWKLAEIHVIEDITGITPVLLLDDVMSELDESRRHALTRFVGDRAQTFVTTTNLGYFEAALIDSAKVVNLG